MASEFFYYVDGQDEGDDEYSKAVDIWALGCVVFKLITKRSPFPPSPSLRKYCLNRDLFPGEEIASLSSSACETFIKHLLRPDPTHRPSATEAAEDPWIVSGSYTEHSLHARGSKNEIGDTSQQIGVDKNVLIWANEQQSLQEQSKQQDMVTTLDRAIARMATEQTLLEILKLAPNAEASKNEHVAGSIRSPNSQFPPATGASRERVQSKRRRPTRRGNEILQLDAPRLHAPFPRKM